MRVDLNADLGEGFGRWRLGDDDALLELITSANVACGFHAGDPLTMRRVCAAAAAHGVSVGAQVGYRDLAGFGRRRIDYEPDELAADVLYQIGALQACSGGRVRYVKPHGALYNTAVTDRGQADAIARAVADCGGLPLLGLPASELERAAGRHGLAFVREGFADRAYRPDGTLVPRREPGAVLHGVPEVADQALRLAATVQSICLHGDTPGAVRLAAAVRDALAGAGHELRPFAG